MKARRKGQRHRKLTRQEHYSKYFVQSALGKIKMLKEIKRKNKI